MSSTKSSAAAADDLVLENYGAGYAWLRREVDAAIADTEQVERDMARLLDRYTLTQAGP